MNWEAIFNSAALGLVCAASMLHLNRMTGASATFIERFGFSLTAGGAFGVALAYWLPWRGAESVETLFHAGLAAVAVSLLQGYARAWLAKIPGFEEIERRERT